MLAINRGLVHTSLICSLSEFWPFPAERYMCVVPSHESYFQANCSVSSPVKAVSHLTVSQFFHTPLVIAVKFSSSVWTMGDDGVYNMQGRNSLGDLIVCTLDSWGETKCFSPLCPCTGLTDHHWHLLYWSVKDFAPGWAGLRDSATIRGRFSKKGWFIDSSDKENLFTGHND